MFQLFLALAQAMKRRSATRRSIEANRAQQKADQEVFDAQQRAARLRQRVAEIRARREKIQAIREARVRKANLLSDASQGSVGASSSLVGALSNVRSQFGSELNKARFISGTLAEISASNIAASERAQEFLNRAAYFRGKQIRRNARTSFFFKAFKAYGDSGGFS